MGHLVQAARQLVDEVTAASPKSKVTVLPEVDGLGFNRSIRIEGSDAKKIADALDAADDRRVAGVVRSAKGLRVTFVTGTLADFRQPFELAGALAVLDGD